jgi:hypothetical protein
MPPKTSTPNTSALSFSDQWIEYTRKKNKSTLSFACILCPERRVLPTAEELRSHAQLEHLDQLPHDPTTLNDFLKDYEAQSALKK